MESSNIMYFIYHTNILWIIYHIFTLSDTSLFQSFVGVLWIFCRKFPTSWAFTLIYLLTMPPSVHNWISIRIWFEKYISIKGNKRLNCVISVWNDDERIIWSISIPWIVFKYSRTCLRTVTQWPTWSAPWLCSHQPLIVVIGIRPGAIFRHTLRPDIADCTASPEQPSLVGNYEHPHVKVVALLRGFVIAS